MTTPVMIAVNCERVKTGFVAGPVISLNQVDSSSAMQNSQAGLQNLLEAPSLDIMDNLPDIQEDEMWLDLFPGLLTQN